MSNQHAVVIATVSTSAACVLNMTPFFASMSSAIDVANDVTIATISHQAVTRHQNQRTR